MPTDTFQRQVSLSAPIIFNSEFLGQINRRYKLPIKKGDYKGPILNGSPQFKYLSQRRTSGRKNLKEILMKAALEGSNLIIRYFFFSRLWQTAPYSDSSMNLLRQC